MKKDLKELAELLSLSDDREYAKSVEITLNESQKYKESQIQKARMSILKIIIHAIRNDFALKDKLSPDFRKILNANIKAINEMNTLESIDFTRVVYMIKGEAERILSDYNFAEMIALFEEKNKTLNDSTVNNALTEAKSKTTKSDKINAIKSLLMYWQEAVNKKIVKYIKDNKLEQSDDLKKVISNFNTKMKHYIEEIEHDGISPFGDIVDSIEKLTNEDLIIMNAVFNNNSKLIKDEKTSKKVSEKETKKEKENDEDLEIAIAPKKHILKREKVGGKLNHPIKDFFNKHKTKIIALGLVVTVGISSYLIGKHSNKPSTNEPDLPSITDVIPDSTDTLPEDNTIIVGTDDGYMSEEGELAEKETAIKESAKKVYANWSQITDIYTEEDIIEIMKAVNGMDSSISLDEAYDAIDYILNMVTAPAVNNALSNTNAETKNVEISDLLIGCPDGIDAVVKMEDNLNSAISNPANCSTGSAEVIDDEYTVINDEQTVDGLSIYTENQKISDPGVRILWSLETINYNAICGVSEISDEVKEKLMNIDTSSKLQSIIKDAKTDLGDNAKTLTLN